MQVLLRPQWRQRANNKLTGTPLKAGRRGRIARTTEPVTIDAVGDVTNLRRIDTPDITRNRHQRERRHDKCTDTPEGESPEFYPARDLPLHFVRPEATFQMDMGGDRKKAGHQCPLDRSPIVGQQQIRRQLGKHAAYTKK